MRNWAQKYLLQYFKNRISRKYKRNYEFPEYFLKS